MRLLADENTHVVVVSWLRQSGFDVEWVAATMPGASDTQILARSDIAAFVLVTNDRDFGDLIFNRGLPHPRSILYTRLPHREPEQTAARLIALLEAGVPAGQMTTITRDGVRSKPFPAGASHG